MLGLVEIVVIALVLLVGAAAVWGLIRAVWGKAMDRKRIPRH